MKGILERIEKFMEFGGIWKDIALLAISGVAVVCSLVGFQPFPFDCAWIAIAFCGLPIVTEAVIGLITAFDIKADVLVSLALIASILQIPAILRANFIKPPAARPRNTARREKGNGFISMNCKCIKTHDLCLRILFR